MTAAVHRVALQRWRGFWRALAENLPLAPLAEEPKRHRDEIDYAGRQQRLFDQINADTQHLMRESEYVRAEFWSKADRASHDLAKWSASTDDYRRHFYDEVIGRFDDERLPPNAALATDLR